MCHNRLIEYACTLTGFLSDSFDFCLNLVFKWLYFSHRLMYNIIINFDINI